MSCVHANILTHRPGADGGSHEEREERCWTGYVCSQTEA